ncbi:MAG: sodium:proton antiporter [Lachnospiraceae bacterium]|nr:sodium:proton antiporter [Lachnospiraceae bacterium]
MDSFLPFFVLLMLLVVGLGFFNEKVTKLTGEIALMLFSTVIGAVLLIVEVVTTQQPLTQVIQGIHGINLESFLMDGVLCFMLFSGSCHMKLFDFRKQARGVAILSFLATFLGAVFYGLLFFAVSGLLGLGLSIPVCLMFGSIVAPTDPIAATSILNKFGLPKDTSFLIEAESLLNDGVGVAVFVCFSNLVTKAESEGFFTVLVRELFGAILVGLIVTLVCYPVFSRTNDVMRRIFTSLFAVSAVYLLCEIFDFSGAIASVVCGVMFAYLREYSEDKGAKWDMESYDAFWDVLDNLLNSILYVILGLSFIYILQMPKIMLVSLGAIVCNLIGRSGSVGICTFLMGKLPDGYGKWDFTKLLTWGGLRGGLCIALAMSAKSMLSEDMYRIILGGTCAVVFFTTIIQGLTMKKVYQRIEAYR